MAWGVSVARRAVIVVVVVVMFPSSRRRRICARPKTLKTFDVTIRHALAYTQRTPAAPTDVLPKLQTLSERAIVGDCRRRCCCLVGRLSIPIMRTLNICNIT